MTEEEQNERIVNLIVEFNVLREVVASLVADKALASRNSEATLRAIFEEVSAKIDKFPFQVGAAATDQMVEMGRFQLGTFIQMTRQVIAQRG